MNLSRTRRYESNRAVRKYYTTDRPNAFSSDLGREVTTEHDGLTTELDKYFVNASSGDAADKEWTHSRAENRTVVRNSLESVHRAGQLLPSPGPPNEDRLPMAREAGDRQLVSDAKSTLAKALPLADLLVKHGLPRTVLDSLPGQIQALDDAMLNQRTGRQTRKASNAAVDTLLSRASALQKKMDTLPKQDADTMAIWRDARHVGPRRQKPAPAVAAPTAPPSTPPSDKVA